MKRWTLSVVLAGAAIAVAADIGTARTDAVLPEFRVLDAGGGVLHSADLQHERNWVIVYLRPGCEPCDAMLGAFDKDYDPPVPERIAIIVGGVSRAEARQIAVAWPRFAGARWYADPAGEAFERLHLQGVPAILGLQADNIRWTLAGSPASGAETQSILASWLR